MTVFTSCEKCGASLGGVVRKYKRTFVPYLYYSDSMYPMAPPKDPCVERRCPANEHLHARCLCGYLTVEPCVGQTLGEPYERPVIVTPQRRPSWLARVFGRLGA